MVYEYKVKYNGKWYAPGEDVPEKSETPDEKSGVSYTKTDINRMSISDLRVLAKKTGADPSSMTGAEIKEYLITLFGL